MAYDMNQDQMSQAQCEYYRQKTKQIFDKVRPTWTDMLQWIAPERATWLLSRQRGQRANHHIVDITHQLALRTFQAGFMEGNTSATRPWFDIQHPDPDVNGYSENRAWLDRYTDRCLAAFNSSNFYNSEALFYYDFGAVNNGCQYIENIRNERLHYHNLEPGSYYVLNNAYGLPIVLCREFSMSVEALVKRYGKRNPKSGKYSMDNFSQRVKDAWERGDYAQCVDVVNVVKENEDYKVELPPLGANRPWISMHYELGGTQSNYSADGEQYGGPEDAGLSKRYLEISYDKRKPFVQGRTHSGNNFEWGENGPATMAIGAIKSLNKKAVAKDVAMEKMISPTLQGPNSLNKTSISNQTNRFIPLDPTAMQQGGIKPVFEVNQGIGVLIQDVTDLRQFVDECFYANFLQYLIKNPKTRTAEETRAILSEQQLVIGPNLKSLDWTHNIPHLEYVMDWVLDNDPYLGPAPDGLQGQTLKVEFISTFAQAQKAADLPNIQQYVTSMMNLHQMDPNAGIADKVDFDRYADLLEDRLYIPAGLNRDQDKVEEMRQRQAAAIQRQQTLNETIPNLAGAAKNLSGIEQT